MILQIELIYLPFFLLSLSVPFLENVWLSGILEQVVARWRPEESCRPELEDAPVFYPTEEVFLNASGFVYHHIFFLYFSCKVILKFIVVNCLISKFVTTVAGIWRYFDIYCEHTSKSRTIWDLSYCPAIFLETSMPSEAETYLGEF